MKKLLILLSMATLFACKTEKKESSKNADSSIKVVGAMRDAMWKGELFAKIELDTIKNTNGLYGLGPQTNLTGELLIADGKTYLSKVTSDSTMSVENTNKVSAPFFVYGNATEWKEISIPSTIKTSKQLEEFVTEKAIVEDQPFLFKIEGKVNSAEIHIQNLPEGTKVSSPKEVHQGQVNYNLQDEEVMIVGFFSKNHQSIFTHHDSFVHMHLITKDKSKMGHLDKIDLSKASLFIAI